MGRPKGLPSISDDSRSELTMTHSSGPAAITTHSTRKELAKTLSVRLSVPGPFGFALAERGPRCVGAAGRLGRVFGLLGGLGCAHRFGLPAHSQYSIRSRRFSSIMIAAKTMVTSSSTTPMAVAYPACPESNAFL